MSIHDLPLSQVNAEALDALVANAVAESRHLDYKERLPGDSDADKRELLADVTAFANTAGGDLIYGVRERRKGGATGEPDAIIGLPDVLLDEVKLRLDSILRTGMEPRIPGLVLHPVSRGPKPPCLVIRVPRSPHGIHMVTFKGASRFYGRGAAGRFELDWGQIRAGFLQAEGAHERVRRFREERVLRLLAGETPILMGAGPKVIFHALPLNSLDVWPVFLTLIDHSA
jgi:predicted HTH transcriptional regulator